MGESKAGRQNKRRKFWTRAQRPGPSSQSEGKRVVFSRLTGAFVRALLVLVLIATPSVLLPGVGPDSAQVVFLMAIFGAALTFFEYSSAYPSLVEFRDAPPFNRVRFVSLFLTVFLLTVIFRGQTDPTTLTLFVEATGSVIGQAIDFPYSPVRLVVLMLPENASIQNLILVRTTAGLSYLIALVTLAIFLILLRLHGWPSKDKAFNVWINLPTFDPTAGGDVVVQLQRDARINIILGFTLPFISPMIVRAAASLFHPITLESPQTMVWTMAAWSFLPLSLFMRGIAMGRIASMIKEKRKRASAMTDEDGFMHA